MAKALMMSTNAITGLVTVCSVSKIGSVPRPPNHSMDVRRPMRSDSMPNSGCISLYTNNAQVMIRLAVLTLMPAEFTRYFCMWAVKV